MADFTNPFKGQVLAEPIEPNRTRRFKRRSRRGILYAFLALVSFVALAGLFAKPLYRAGKEWRAGGLMKEAEREFEKENWVGAMRAAHAAFLLSPTNMANLRLISEIFDRVKSPRALEMLGRVVAAEGKEEDRRKLIAMALRSEQIGVARSHAEVLLQGNPDSRENLLLAAQVARAESDFPQELQLLQSLRARFIEDEEVAFLHDRALLNVGAVSQIADALSRIKSMTDQGGAIGLSALEVYATRAPASEWAQVAAKLRKHPLATMQHWTLAADLEVRGAVESRRAVAASLADRAIGKGLEEITVAATWLQQQQQYQELLKLVPRERALSAEELALVHIDALLGLKQNEQVRTLLAEPRLFASPGLKRFYEWQLNQLEGSQLRSDKDAKLAIDAAFEFPPSLAFLAARFEALGRADLAGAAYARLKSSGSLRKMATEGLFRIAFRRADTQAALTLFEERLRGNPGDPWVQNNVTYFHLLLERPVDPSLKIAQKLVDDYPDRVAYRSTLALAHLRAENPAAALQMFPAAEFRWQRAVPSTRAVYAAVLKANRKMLEADEIEASLAKVTLFPEERALLTNSVGKR